MKKKKLDIFNLFYSGAAVVILIGVIAKLLEWPAQDILITGGLAIEAVVFGVSAIKFVEVEEKSEVATEATLAKVADGLGQLASSATAKDTYINIQTGSGATETAPTGVRTTMPPTQSYTTQDQQVAPQQFVPQHTTATINIGQVEAAPTSQTVAQPAKPVVEVITNPFEAPKAKSVSIDINTTKAAAAPQASTTAINPAHSLWQLEQMDILSLAKDLFFQPEWDNLNAEEYVNLSKLFKRVFDKKLPSKESIQFLLQFPVKLPVPELSKLTLSKAHELSVLEVELLGKAFEIVNYTTFLDHFVFEQEAEVITVRTKKINETQIFGGEQAVVLSHTKQFYGNDFIISPNIDCIADMIKLKGKLLVEQLIQKVSIKSEEEFISLSNILVTQSDELKKKLFIKVKKLKFNLSNNTGYSYLKTIVQTAISFRESMVGQDLFKNILEIQVDDSLTITLDDVVNCYAETIYFGSGNEYSVVLNELFVKGELNNLGYVHQIIEKLVADNVATKSKLLQVFNLKEQDTKKDVFNKLNYHLNKTNTAPSGAQLAFILLYKQYS
jgi:hypothetical protein